MASSQAGSTGSSNFQTSSTTPLPSSSRSSTTFLTPSSTSIESFTSFSPTESIIPSQASTIFQNSSTKPLASSSRISTTSLTPTSTSIKSFTSLLPTESTIPSQALNSGSRLTTGAIAAIVSGSLLFLLSLAACFLLCFIRRRPQRPSAHKSVTESSTGSSDYYGSQQYASETRGTASLIQHTSWEPRWTNGADRFINEDDEVVNPPQSHTVTSDDLNPSPQFGEDSVLLLPHASPHPVPSAMHPSLLATPEFVPPPHPRRPSRGKRSIQSTRQMSSVLDEGYDSDDSASMYSQGSASTSLFASQFRRTSLSSTVLDSETGDLARGDTVGRLLQSRQRNSHPPSRSASVVSHIERTNSINPTLPFIKEGVATTNR